MKLKKEIFSNNVKHLYRTYSIRQEREKEIKIEKIVQRILKKFEKNVLNTAKKGQCICIVNVDRHLFNDNDYKKMSVILQKKVDDKYGIGKFVINPHGCNIYINFTSLVGG